MCFLSKHIDYMIANIMASSIITRDPSSARTIILPIIRLYRYTAHRPLVLYCPSLLFMDEKPSPMIAKQ